LMQPVAESASAAVRTVPPSVRVIERGFYSQVACFFNLDGRQFASSLG
jgi:hypothetical protein